MKVRDCLLGIYLKVVVVLIQIGILQPIISKKAAYMKGKYVESTNGYFRIADKNLVWMHVQDGYGIIINEFITTRSGKRVNLVELLSGYYWYIENQTGIIKAHELENRAIYRCIMSIILYDDIKKKMPKWLEVHHKWWKWCNTQNTITEACHNKHQYFHNFVNTRKSHQKGVVISDVGELLHWKNTIMVEDAKLKNQPM